MSSLKPPVCDSCGQPMELKARLGTKNAKRLASGKKRTYTVRKYECDLCNTVETLYGDNERTRAIESGALDDEIGILK